MNLLFSQAPLMEPFRWMAVLSSIGMTISAAEHLAGLRHFQDDGLLSWPVMRTQGGWAMRGFSGKMAEFFLCYRHFRFLLVLRLLCAIAAGGLAVFDHWVPLIWFLLLLTTVSLNFRTGFGLDGAYQMNVIVMTGVFCASLFSESRRIQALCLAFVALEAVLSYAVAGYWKLVSPVWRAGKAMEGIFSTSMYGHPFVYQLLAGRRSLGLALSWTVIVFECTFALSILAPKDVLHSYLALGCAFHASTAIFMGLNGFFFAFVSTYPAVAYVANWISNPLWKP